MKRALIVANSLGMISSFLENDIILLQKRGYKIDCACNINYSANDSSFFVEKYNLHLIHIDFSMRKLKMSNVFCVYHALAKVIKNTYYELVHCHTTIASVITRQITKKYRKRGMKVVYTSHGFPFFKGANFPQKVVFRLIENYYSKFTDGIITICEEDYTNAKVMKCKKVYRINGVGVDLTKYTCEKIDKKKYRQMLGIDIDKEVILSIGEINTNKNHEIVIKALSVLDDDIVYVICGRELTEHGKREELEMLAEKLNVTVIFLGYRDDIPQVCMCSDIGAFPSLKEGLGLAGIEMLAAGLPIAGANRQGIKDYVKDGLTGFLADPTNVTEYAEAIKKTIFLSTDKKTKLECQNMASKFSKECAYRKMEQIYENLLI